MSILYKPLTEEEAQAGIRTVELLNKEIEARFPNPSDIKLIVWASDQHLHPVGGYPFNFGGIYDYIDCSRQFMLCLHEINALAVRPDSIIFGGDITEMGMEAEWDELDRILNLGICDVPTYPVFGNHEHLYLPPNNEMSRIWKRIKRPNWPDFDTFDEVFYSVTVNNVKYIIVDTVKLPNVVMSDRQKDFLATEIKNSDKPTLIFQHAQIMNAGNWTDGSLYLDKDMINIINESENVLGVFSGHTHKASLWHYLGKFYGTFPSVAYSIGPCTGWGGIVLDKKGIKGVFYKELHGESYDDCIGHRKQEGKFVFMEPKSYERDPLLNPFFWYRHPDPSKRGIG